MATIRLFAAARASLGRSEIQLAELGLGSDATLGELTEQLQSMSPDAVRVIAACSVLVDGRQHPAEVALGEAQLIDILPPFAGG